MLSKIAQKIAKIWASFGGKFVKKNFQRSPNPVTLD